MTLSLTTTYDIIIVKIVQTQVNEITMNAQNVSKERERNGLLKF